MKAEVARRKSFPYSNEIKFVHSKTVLKKFLIYPRGWSGTNSAITAVVYWPNLSALDDRW
jgi:hypothetical protein